MYSRRRHDLSETSSEVPNVYEYLDFRRYLGDWFASKKQRNPKFSYRMFARMAGQKSPSLLHHVVRGDRNLTAATTEAFVRAMKLSVPDAAFFGLLVQLGQATTDTERNDAWERIAATRRFREARLVEGAGFAYLSHWYYPAIRELAHRDDFRADPAWIASTLRPRITAAKATRALRELMAMRLLVEHEGRVRPAEASVVTPHEVAGLAVHNYHAGMLARAREAIDAFDPEERHFGGLTVAVPADLVPRLKEELVAFQERVLNLCDSASGASDQVYQVNLHLFPLSAPRES